MRLPTPRGPLSEHLVRCLRRPAARPADLRPVPAGGPEDEQLALYVLQELSFRPIDGVDARWEEAPSFLALRAALEGRLEQRLHDAVAVPSCDPDDVAGALVALLEAEDGPSVAAWMEERGELDHLREFVTHRSAYQLKEADPHSFAIPRLANGEAKAALLEIQADEYGGTNPTESHARLFADTMAALGLDPGAGPDLDRIPAVTLATDTLLGWLGRSRRLTGALLGHLAVFEMTSVEPMASFAAAVRRVVGGEEGTAAARFFDVHVAADGFHQRLALERMVVGLATEHPELAPDVLFGAAAVLHVERAFAEHVLACWDRGETSLLRPLPGSALAAPASPLAAAG